ncbi:MAG: neutral zinc metallopeptidase [Erythrobacter sp.]|nr:neutral zinc metallopeptidase [Erythrobacter sp.]
MRLNRFDTSKIKVTGGRGGGVRRAGGIGCGTIVIALIAALVLGVDPMQTIGMIEGTQPQQTSPQAQQGGQSEDQICTSSAYATEACNALTSLNETWAPIFARANIQFEDPTLRLYPSGPVSTRGCGNASSAAGPFYCPADMTIYIDTAFYDTMARQMGAPGDFARYYVMAHEYGHHIQNLTGIATQVRSIQQRNPSQSNQLQVRMELQADCYAGVWAGQNRNLIEPGDMQEGLRAASAIGDDTLQRRAGQRINPENFTHGTSDQRMQALRRGLETADGSACDVYFDFS